ncbi:MAG TPA: hypothetical protein VEA41_01850 [Salinarimonas sp.]|nr:hypothetical protein [Salinarimonas sp.]
MATADPGHNPDVLFPDGAGGGQSLTGGTGSGDDLTLSSTSHATKGTIFFGTTPKCQIDEATGCITITRTSAGNAILMSSTSEEYVGKTNARVFIGTEDNNDLYLMTNFVGRIHMSGLTSNLGNIAFRNDGSASAGAYNGMKFLHHQTVPSAAGATLDNYLFEAGTITLTGSTNVSTATGFNVFTLQRSTLTSSNAITVTNAATVYIANAPAAAGSTTITNAYALWCDAGLARFDGNGTDIFELPADATDPTGGGGAATGRIPVRIGGTTRYLAYY